MKDHLLETKEVVLQGKKFLIKVFKKTIRGNEIIVGRVCIDRTEERKSFLKKRITEMTLELAELNK